MNEDANQALEIIRREGPKLVLDIIPNIYERGTLEQLIDFSLGAKNLWQTIRNTAIDQNGLIGLTPDRIDRQSMTYFHKILNHHLPQLTYEQIEALIQTIHDAGTAS